MLILIHTRRPQGNIWLCHMLSDLPLLSISQKTKLKLYHLLTSSHLQFLCLIASLTMKLQNSPRVWNGSSELFPQWVYTRCWDGIINSRCSYLAARKFSESFLTLFTKKLLLLLLTLVVEFIPNHQRQIKSRNSSTPVYCQPKTNGLLLILYRIQKHPDVLLTLLV